MPQQTTFTKNSQALVSVVSGAATQVEVHTHTHTYRYTHANYLYIYKYIFIYRIFYIECIYIYINLPSAVGSLAAHSPLDCGSQAKNCLNIKWAHTHTYIYKQQTKHSLNICIDKCKYSHIYNKNFICEFVTFRHTLSQLHIQIDNYLLICVLVCGIPLGFLTISPFYHYSCATNCPALLVQQICA